MGVKVLVFAFDRQGEVIGRRLLGLFDYPVEQDDGVGGGEEKGAGDAAGEMSADLINLVTKVSHERHSKRPTVLHGFDVFADKAFFFLG